jgi:hypothetical protein
MKNQHGAYMMAYFRSGPGQTDKTEALHYAYSRDGLKWYELNENQAVWTTKLGEGIIRDPFISRGADGRFHLVYTLRPAGKQLGYAASADLLSWQDERPIPAMDNYEHVANSWAPEFSYDPEQDSYTLYWASSLGGKIDNNKHYCLTTRDWQTFSEARLFFDPGYRTIDACITDWNGKYYMIYKDEEYVYDKARQPHPPGNKLAVADKLEGPYEVVSDFITPDFTEGPEFLKLKDQEKWLLLYDYWAHGRIGVMESTDLRHWSSELSDTRFPYRARHFTVFEVSEEELDAVLKRYAVQANYVTQVFSPVRIADRASSGRLHDGFKTRSVVMSLQPESLRGTQVLYDEGGPRNGLAIRIRDGRIEAVAAGEGDHTSIGAPLEDIPQGGRLQIAVVFNEGELLLYVNGELAASERASFDWIAPHDDAGGYGGRFGTDAFGGSDGAAAFKGAIQRLTLYSVPLHACDIARLWGEKQ